MRDTCLVLHVQRAARVLARRFDEAFRPLGLETHRTIEVELIAPPADAVPPADAAPPADAM